MKIININSLFKIDKQFLHIEFDDSKVRVIDFNEISNIIRVSAYELELLIESEVIPKYYSKGEINLFGQSVTFDNLQLKGFTLKERFNRKNSIETFAHKLLEFKTISEIKEITNKKGTSSLTINFIDNSSCFVRAKDLKAWTGLEEKHFAALMGQKCCPRYFKKDEVMSDFYGQLNYCTSDNTIVKSLNLRFDDNNFEKIKENILKIDKGINIYEIKKPWENNFNNDDDDNDNSYEKYNGYNDWDDDTIDNAFEGDPDATWNVD